ncbi:hypothetical protein CEE97_10955, partial [Lactobacillus crispatus]
HERVAFPPIHRDGQPHGGFAQLPDQQGSGRDLVRRGVGVNTQHHRRQQRAAGPAFGEFDRPQLLVGLGAGPDVAHHRLRQERRVVLVEQVGERGEEAVEIADAGEGILDALAALCVVALRQRADDGALVGDVL